MVHQQRDSRSLHGISPYSIPTSPFEPRSFLDISGHASRSESGAADSRNGRLVPRHRFIPPDERPDSTLVPWIPDPIYPGRRAAVTPTAPAGGSPHHHHHQHSVYPFAHNDHRNTTRGSPRWPVPSPSTPRAMERDTWIPLGESRGAGGVHMSYGKNCNIRKLQARSDRSRTRRRFAHFVLIAAGLAIMLVLLVFTPVYLWFRSSNRGDGSEQSSAGGGKDGSRKTPGVNHTGGDLSVAWFSNGTQFVYHNPFNGYWCFDPTDPFNTSARANDYTPPLNTSWRWGVDRIFGVNLGGLFVLEPFITPELFERYSNASASTSPDDESTGPYPGTPSDEWQLSRAMRAVRSTKGTGRLKGLSDLEDHYRTFVTEEDIVQIVGAGLNWLRIPIGYWAIETYHGEFFLKGTSWTYFLQIVEWARKYGLRIFLDFHALPGGQNGMNHSGREDHIAFLRGPMGLANAQRALYYIRLLSDFISLPQYRDVILVLGIVNEPLSFDIGMDTLEAFYTEAYRVVRGESGHEGPYLAIGDGLRSALAWQGLLPNAERVVMDAHPYVAFDALYDAADFNASPLVDTAEDGKAGGAWPGIACRRWSGYIAKSKSTIGYTVAGEFSAAINDCSRYLRSVSTASSNPQCALYDDWEQWNATLKEGLESFVLASMDAVGDWFFWTWKIGKSRDGKYTAPFWSYKLGLENGWIPKDPRVSVGKCAALGVTPSNASTHNDDGSATFYPWRTGMIEASESQSALIPQPSDAHDAGSPPFGIPSDYVAAHRWPPATITNDDQVPVSLLPVYTNTGERIRLGVMSYKDGVPEVHYPPPPSSPTRPESGESSTGTRRGTVTTSQIVDSTASTRRHTSLSSSAAPTSTASVTVGAQSAGGTLDVRYGGVGPIQGCEYLGEYAESFEAVPTKQCDGSLRS